MKILLAVDGSTYSDAAIEEVARRPWPPPTEVKIINAVEIPLLPGMEDWAVTPAYLAELERAVRDGAQAVIEAALSKLNTATSLKVSSEIIPGSPRRVIAEEAERWEADLIVIGSRGLGTWNRLLLGSVSSSVVHHAPCSVEIVRMRPAHESGMK